MEKKTKHRMLGFAVIAAIIIIVFPFLEKEKGLPPQGEKYVTPPPFPVPASATISANGVNAQPADTIPTTSPMPVVPTIKTASNNQTNVIPVVTSNVKDVAKDSSATSKDKITYLPSLTKSEDAPVKPQVASGDSLRHNIEEELFNIKSQIVSNTRKKIAQFTQVKSSAWVVQLGVFKEKSNAVKLINQLRANGYHAFMTKSGETTKVFVGPENKQNAAHVLASRLEQEMHIRGVVINYKPFTL